MTKKKNRKFQRMLISFLLLFVLLASGTYAWSDFTQHKTNEFYGDGKLYEVSLNEDFSSQTSWKVGETVKKIVNVTNQGRKDKDGAMFVRVQFKEYLEYTEGLQVFSNHRYMIDYDGGFLTFDTQEDAEKYLQQEQLPTTSLDGKNPRIEKNKPYNGIEKYYIVTQADDPNGQYGRFLVVGFKDMVTTVIGGGSSKSDAPVTEHHVPGPNKDDQYNNINWLDENSPYRKYVQLNHGVLGSDFILASEWDGQPVRKWIIDDSINNVENGYIYWGEELQTKETTPNVLDSVTLIESLPGQAFYYATHVNLEAASQDEISIHNEWENVDEKIINMIQNYQ